MRSNRSQTISRIDVRALMAFFLPFLLYIVTLAPTIYNLDSAELTTAAATGGLVRSTGYPLYLLLGHLWSLIPIGDVGYRMNLFSAFCGALTILLLDRIFRRMQVGMLAAFSALGLLATSPYFWGLSLVAEVYTLHTVLMAIFILALLSWEEHPSVFQLAVVGLVAGLGLAHHLAMALLLPAAVIFVLIHSWRDGLTPKSILAVVLATLAGLSLYLYLPVRFLTRPLFNYVGVYDATLQFHPVDLLTLQGMWWLVSGKAFTGQMFGYTPADLLNETTRFLSLLWQAFFALGIGPGVVGLVLHVRANWRRALLLVLMFTMSAGFYINYRVVDKDTMYLPAYLVWTIWLGVGYQVLFVRVRRAVQEGAWGWSPALLAGLMAGAVFMALGWNWRLVDLSNDWSSRRRGESILAIAAPDAIVFGWWDTVPVVQYLQFVEGKRPDILAVNRFLISPEDVRLAIEMEVKIRPIYIDNSPNLSDRNLRLQPTGPLYHLVPVERSLRSSRLPPKMWRSGR